jgi:hypothetical protein
MIYGDEINQIKSNILFSILHMRANLPSYVQNKIIEVCCKMWFHIISHKISLRIHDHLIRAIDHYFMIRKLLNPTFYVQWELKSLYWRSKWTHRTFCLPKVWYTFKDDLDRVHWPWFNLSSQCTYVICIIPVHVTKAAVFSEWQISQEYSTITMYCKWLNVLYHILY